LPVKGADTHLIATTGFLAGAYKSPDDLSEDDYRRSNPRFEGEAFKENLKLVDPLNQVTIASLPRPELICFLRGLQIRRESDQAS
jgi:hypothetical protein